MRFFSAPYEIVANDVAGSCQCRTLTDGAFQDEIWEDLLSTARDVSASAEPDNEWLVRERYVRDLGVPGVSERIAILASLEGDADASTLHLFTRALRPDGTPLACGFTTLACTVRGSTAAARIPRAITDLFQGPNGYREPLASTFAELALSAQAAEALFPDEVRAMAGRVVSRENGTVRRPNLRATTRLRASGVLPSAIDGTATAGSSRHSGALALSLPGFAELAPPVRGAVLTFPGDNSYDGRLLRELHAYAPYLSNHFHQADDVARRFFRQEFLPLVEVDTLALHDQRLERCPELAHLGVVLCGMLIAETLQEYGIRPDVLIGEGLGELSALAVAGAIDVGTGLKLAAHRALALRRQQNGSSVEETGAGSAGALGEITFATPRFQIFLAGAQGAFGAEADFGRALATWLTRVADFDAAVAAARAAGCDLFIECGPNGVLPMREAADAAVSAPLASLMRDGMAGTNIPSLRRPESPHDAHA